MLARAVVDWKKADTTLLHARRLEQLYDAQEGDDDAGGSDDSDFDPVVAAMLPDTDDESASGWEEVSRSLAVRLQA